MFLPRRVKHRKQQRGKRRGLAYRGSKVSFGSFGLKSLETAWLTSAQIEACRIVINRRLKRGGKIWIRVFPDKPITSKPAETRMGKGKGSPDSWVAVIKPGRILFELDGVPEDIAKEAFTLASHRLPVLTKFVNRGDLGV